MIEDLASACWVVAPASVVAGRGMSTVKRWCRRRRFIADSRADGLDSTVDIPGLLAGLWLALGFARRMASKTHMWIKRDGPIAEAVGPGLLTLAGSGATIPHCPQYRQKGPL